MLEFENSDAVNVNMSSLQGKIKTTYDKLVEVFGEPTFTDASPYEKVNAQWTLDIKVPFVDEYGKTLIMLQRLSIIGKMDISLLKNMIGISVDLDIML